jgi:hypothetical protein
MRRGFLGALLLVAALAAAAQPAGPPDRQWPDGTKYWGALRFGSPHGPGYMTGNDGRAYQGEFVDGKFHGRGWMRMPNGDEYRGGFADGLFEGEGTLKYAKPPPGTRTEVSGTWRQGKLEDTGERNRMLQNVETALYNQRALLDAAIGALAPADKGRINLYLLAVAGDGSQEVFRREVEFVRAQFDRDFGTRGRSLVLVNSRSTVATAPMATVTTIREAIRTIAARMDRDNDILFLYLTSHGAKDHELTLNQNAMSLRGLRPKELAGMLEESRIRWKVVLVSACYSGAFVEPLKSESTMVITASRADRTSFGCSDENDFTYFGRAFFKEALPASGSFFEAFTRARALVGEWEKEDKAPEAERSLPQVYSPLPISERLQRWWAQPRR